MDVSFTNVLEGARQYFQGLPTANNSSSAGPVAAYSTTTPPSESLLRNNNEELPPSSASSSSTSSSTNNTTYWTSPPQQQQEMVRPPTREQTPIQRPPSHHSDSSSRPPSHSQMVVVPEQNRQVNHYQNYQEQFQFPRPHSREINTSTPQQQQQYYQSQQFVQNVTYHQPQSPQQQQQRAPSRQEMIPPPSSTPQQTYHNLQNFGQSSQGYHNYQHQQQQQQRLYSPSKPQNLQNSQEHPYYKHLYTPHNQNSSQQQHGITTQNQTTTSQQQQQQQQQSYRTTHNLPPIAALSSISYHSNRNHRDVRQPFKSNQIPQNIQKTTMTTTTTTTANSASIQNSINNNNNNKIPYNSENYRDYRENSYYNQQQQQQQQQRLPGVSQNYQYNNNNTPASTQNYSQAAMTSSHTSVSYTVTTPMQNQSSSSNNQQQQQHYYQSNKSNYEQQPQQQQQYNDHLSSTPQNHHYQQQSATTTAMLHDQNNRTIPITKQKRESPLDLSVKTIRTPADSTLDDVEQQDARNKYYRTNSYVNMPITTTSTTTRAVAANNLPSATAPKIEFHPNFNVPTLNSMNNYKRNNTNEKMRIGSGNNRYPTVNVPTVNSYIQSTPTQKRAENLPRIDFPTPNYNNKSSYDVQKKRSADTPPSSIIPNKLSKVDTWRQSIDQQIEQRLSSYKQQQLQQQQQQQQQQIKPVNGTYPNMNTYQRQQQYPAVVPQQYSNTNQYQSNHNQTYVPSAVAHQFPGYANYPTSQQQQQQIYQQQSHNLQRTNSASSLLATGVVNKTTTTSTTSSMSGNNGGADKRVLSLLRNSLEIKNAKEAQKKLEQQQQQLEQTRRLDIQHPSTDVQAPLQPKPGGFFNRQNVSPFTPTNFPETNNIYKLHLPKAVDSVNFESTETSKYLNSSGDSIGGRPITTTEKIDEQSVINHVNPNGDLDGLAAFLAARIRTKAELKQVSPTLNHNLNNSRLHSIIENQLKTTPKQDTICSSNNNNNNNNNSVSPPKLTKERQLYPPRRRLFSRNEDEYQTTTTATTIIPPTTTTVPPRDKSGMRSSSETSVFDFPDTDSETEMPVLERQTLDDLRRDRKISSKSSSTNNNNDKIESLSPIRPQSPPADDDLFAQACDSFMEQLKNGNGKKRGRRKKIVEADVLAKLEVVTKIDDILNDNNNSKKIDENCSDDDDDDCVDDGDDSDVPLINCKTKIDDNLKNDVEIKIIINSDDCDTKKENFGLKDLPTFLPRPAKKPLFGDGSHFSPGWEEEVYKYKKSLRMPPSLIQVTRPPLYHRLSTSLPDLDPCPRSPTPSSIIDTNEMKMKIKSELTIDSDTESNCSINIFNNNNNKTNYDSEGNSSIKSLPITSTTTITTTTTTTTTTTKSTISDRLLERYGRRKRKYKRNKDEVGNNNRPKIVPKSEKIVELLPTPGVVRDTSGGDNKETTKQLDFRKQTIDNFKDVFNNEKQQQQQHHMIRTRKQIRLEQQRATIKEVFGEDRPASAPPVTCVNHIKIKDEPEDVEAVVKIKQETNINNNNNNNNNSLIEANNNNNTKQALKNKLLNRGRKNGGNTTTNDNNNLLKSLVEKKIKTELLEDDKQQQIVVVDDNNKDVDCCKSGTPSIDGDECVTITGKKYKNRNIRRKFSSGFDYIRKKKKQTKPKEQQQPPQQQQDQLEQQQQQDSEIKTIKRNKTSPGTIQDIQKEIKGWVLNKGIGETHLHRSARLGYTDITAYCLEKMECSPSPKDNAGYTPLHEASARGHLGIAKMLLMYGANVSESARGGIRPLHEAVENGYVEVVRLLLSYGADPLLATYSGMTPLALASDELTAKLLQDHIDDVEGKPGPVWYFPGPSSCFDLKETGFDILGNVPDEDPQSEMEEIEFEISDTTLPNLYTLRGESLNDRWVLLQDLSNMLKIKSRDALLKQICPSPSSSTSTLTNHQHYKSVLKELKMSDFLEQAHCCQFLNAGEKINTRASKIALVKYTDKVRELLNVEKVSISIR